MTTSTARSNAALVFVRSIERIRQKSDHQSTACVAALTDLYRDLRGLFPDEFPLDELGDVPISVAGLIAIRERPIVAPVVEATETLIFKQRNWLRIAEGVRNDDPEMADRIVELMRGRFEDADYPLRFTPAKAALIRKTAQRVFSI